MAEVASQQQQDKVDRGVIVRSLDLLKVCACFKEVHLLVLADYSDDISEFLGHPCLPIPRGNAGPGETQCSRRTDHFHREIA